MIFLTFPASCLWLVSIHNQSFLSIAEKMTAFGHDRIVKVIRERLKDGNLVNGLESLEITVETCADDLSMRKQRILRVSADEAYVFECKVDEVQLGKGGIYTIQQVRVHSQQPLAFIRALDCQILAAKVYPFGSFAAGSMSDDFVEEILVQKHLTNLTVGDESDGTVPIHQCILTNHSLISIMPYYNQHDLFYLCLRNQTVMPLFDIKRIFRHLMTGLLKMHNANIAHRDLSCENIYVHRNAEDIEKPRYHLDIGDFGMAIRSNSTQYPCHMLSTRGKPSYKSPEMHAHYDVGTIDLMKCDIWAMGIVLYAMLFHALPFDKPTRFSLKYLDFLAGRYSPVIKHKIESDEGFREGLELIKLMLIPDPARRPTAEQVLLHPWLQLQPQFTSQAMTLSQFLLDQFPIVANGGSMMIPAATAAVAVGVKRLRDDKDETQEPEQEEEEQQMMMTAGMAA